MYTAFDATAVLLYYPLYYNTNYIILWIVVHLWFIPYINCNFVTYQIVILYNHLYLCFCEKNIWLIGEPWVGVLTENWKHNGLLLLLFLIEKKTKEYN